ncbi:anti-sigma factor domain-containing protein [Paenibacillus sp. GCM10023252]|uniref:anti-sigma factor domain-containing protein n=1 Tax=Paenibacillus sp. GCM10023252 TaxID=3252649 RepID=UPI0036131F8B
MNRGLVMEVSRHHMIVMTPDGQFVRVKRQGQAVVGAEVVFSAASERRGTVRWYSYAAAVLVLLCIPILLLVQRDAHAIAAYMSLDINPSIEMGMDRQGQVRELRALNSDGEQLIQGLRYKSLPVEQVAAAILEKAESAHYLDEADHDVVLTSILERTEAGAQYEEELVGRVRLAVEAVIHRNDAQLSTLAVPAELREEADELGISSGKMAVYLIAMQQGYKVSLSELQKQSIDAVTQALGGADKVITQSEALSKEELKRLVQVEKAARKAEKAAIKDNREDDKDKDNDQEQSSTPSPTPSTKPDKDAPDKNKPQKPVPKPSAGEVKNPTKPNKPAKPSKEGSKPAGGAAAPPPAAPGKPDKNQGKGEHGGKHESNQDDNHDNHNNNNEDDNDDSDRRDDDTSKHDDEDDNHDDNDDDDKDKDKDRKSSDKDKTRDKED